MPSLPDLNPKFVNWQYNGSRRELLHWAQIIRAISGPCCGFCRVKDSPKRVPNTRQAN